jgi:uncharacterized protein YcnI
MTLTSETETHETTTVVTVRVPSGADGDLTSTAERQLCRADGIVAVTVEELHGLAPGLSATDVTARVTITRERSAADRSTEAVLAALTGVETSQS